MTPALYEVSAPYYDLIYEPMVDYSKECDLLEALFNRHARRTVRTILDLGCGTGNHSLTLAKRGYAVRGIDLLSTFVEEARKKAQKLKARPTFQEGDMRDLEGESRYDALISMFGAFGHVPRRDALPTLTGFAQHLRPGGLLLYEFWNPTGAIDGHQDWLEREQANLRLLRLGLVTVQDKGRLVRLRMRHFVLQDDRVADEFEEVSTMALYSEDEMGALLRQAGLEVAAMLDWSAKSLESAKGRPYRILAVARRPT